MRRSGREASGCPHRMRHGPDSEKLHAALSFEGVAHDDAACHPQERHLHVAHERRVLRDVLRFEPGFRLRVHPLVAKDVERGHEHPARASAGVAYRDVAPFLGMCAVGKHHPRDHPGDVIGREELRVGVHRKAEGVVYVAHGIAVGIRLKRVGESGEHLVELAGEPIVSSELPFGVLDERAGRAASRHGHGCCSHRDEGGPDVAIAPSCRFQARKGLCDPAQISVLRSEGVL